MAWFRQLISPVDINFRFAVTHQLPRTTLWPVQYTAGHEHHLSDIWIACAYWPTRRGS